VESAATSGDIFAALLAAHYAGDYWAQTNRQAQDKALPGKRGRQACAAHVASMTACKVTALAALQVSGRKVSWPHAVAALAADAASHYVADPRKPLEALAGQLEQRMGKLTFYRLGAPRPGRDDNPVLGTGAHSLDQAWHITWLWCAAVVAASAG
jgi:cobalamin biosynthesis protein CobD/CbiB